MYYIGLDIHKKTISYCIKDVAGKVFGEGVVAATRADLDRWMGALPQPWTVAMEATLFTGWVYDHLRPHAAATKVAHPLMLRAIAAAKKKNDRVDASKIADCLRCDFLPECYMAPTEFRERRRTLRYRNLMVRQATQLKNKMAGLLMEAGVAYNKDKLHQPGYFSELLARNEEIDKSLEPLLRLNREMLVRLEKTERGQLKALARDHQLVERVKRLMTIPAIGPVTTDLGVGSGRCEAVSFGEGCHQLLRAVRGGTQLGRRRATNADFQTTQPAFTDGAGGSGETGAAVERGSGAGLRKGEAEGEL